MHVGCRPAVFDDEKEGFYVVHAVCIVYYHPILDELSPYKYARQPVFGDVTPETSLRTALAKSRKLAPLR